MSRERARDGVWGAAKREPARVNPCPLKVRLMGWPVEWDSADHDGWCGFYMGSLVSGQDDVIGSGGGRGFLAIEKDISLCLSVDFSSSWGDPLGNLIKAVCKHMQFCVQFLGVHWTLRFRLCGFSCPLDREMETHVC